MKLFNVKFDTPRVYAEVRAAAKNVDPNAVVAVNAGSELKCFELQSEAAAKEVMRVMGGELEVIDFDITELMNR